MHDINGKIIYAHKIAYDSRGYTREELLSSNMLKLYTDDSKETVDTQIHNLIEKGECLFEAEHLCKDRTTIPVETRMRYAALGEVKLVLSVCRDITRRRQIEDSLKKYSNYLETLVSERTSSLIKANELLRNQLSEVESAKEAIRKSEEKFKLLFEGSTEGIVYISKEGTIIDVNQQVITRLPVTRQDIVGQNLLEILPLIGLDATSVRASLDKLSSGTEEAGKFEWYMKNAAGDVIILEVIPVAIKEQEQLIGFALFIADVTERRKLEDELLRTEKLDSIGVLAGGIAHDFNNFLTAILGNITLAKLDINPGDEGYDRLSEAENAVLRAKELANQLLTFSKGGMPLKKSTDLVTLVRETALFALRGSNVVCDFFIPDSLWRAQVDGGQIGQVVHNLVLNAQQAMPGGGVCRIECDNLNLRNPQKTGLKNGKYVRIRIKDHGKGIQRENIHKIFDPYFTTKEKGSGLGLTTAYYIIKNHDGLISVDSEPGEGASFSIYLPASKDQVESIRSAEAGTGKLRARILVMDDMEIIRKVLGNMLNQIGYDEIEFACDGSQAVELYRKALTGGKPFDVILMDLTVPGGMGGTEAVKLILEMNPSAKTIVSSGYSDGSKISKFRELGFCGFIGKPYTLAELQNAINAALASN